MHILHVTNSERYSSLERTQARLALRLRDFDHEVVFACVRLDKFPGRRMARLQPCIGKLVEPDSVGLHP